MSHLESDVKSEIKDARTAAGHYRSRGFDPVPVLKLEKFPRKQGWQGGGHADEAFAPDGNIGLILGQKSGGLADVDHDCPEAVRATPHLLLPTGMITGRASAGGSHWWYVADGGSEKATEQFNDPVTGGLLVELRTGGGKKGAQTVVPPSVYPADPKKGRLEPEPCIFFSAGEPRSVSLAELRDAVKRVAAAALLGRYWPVNNRHNAALALAGGLFRAGWGRDEVRTFVRAVCAAADDEQPGDRLRAVDDTEEKLKAGDEKVTGFPALARVLGDKGDVVVTGVRDWLGVRNGFGGTFTGAEGDGDAEGKKPAAATLLVNLAHAAGVKLFRTPDNEAYARVPRDGHAEVYAVNGAQFRLYLTRIFYEAEGRGVGGEAMTTALGTLGACAVFGGEVRDVHARVAPHPAGGIVLDLCDDGWRVVVVRPGGWEVCDQSPVAFRRSPTMRPLPAPTPGGSLAELRRFLNLKSDEDWLLTAAWLAAAVRPTGPYPVLHPKGEQGTAKTTFGRMLRRLLDPNKVDLRQPPREERDLAVASRAGWVIGLDNLSAIQPWLSDALCRVSTGGGFGTRTLYSNDEETTFDFVRPVLITSIGDVIGQPDLLDRTLSIELEPIPDERRKTEVALWAEFDAAAPRILGGLLDVVARALELLPAVEAEKNRVTRMADFATFGEAVARAMGEEPGRFLGILFAARDAADQSALDGSVLAKTLVEWIREKKTFTGTAATLLAELGAAAGEAVTKKKEWPSRASALGTELKKIAPALRRAGVDVATAPRTGSSRKLTITHAPDGSCFCPSPPSPTPPPIAPNALPRRASSGDGLPVTGPSPARHLPVTPVTTPGLAPVAVTGSDGSSDGPVTAPLSPTKPLQNKGSGGSSDGGDGQKQLPSGGGCRYSNDPNRGLSP